MTREENKKITRLAFGYSIPMFMLCILNILSLLFSLPVHAAESTSFPNNCYTFSNGGGNVHYFEYTLLDPTNKVTEATTVAKDDSSLNSEKQYAVFIAHTGPYKGTKGNIMLFEWDSSNNTANSIPIVIRSGLTSNVFYNSEESYGIFKTNLPVFMDSAGDSSAMINYFKTGDLSGSVINPMGDLIDNPDFQDTAYAFTGFTANNKMTATWTGTTERSYLKDEEVEEYVRVSYGFADKDAPDSIKLVDNDTTEYATADKSLTVNVSDLVPDDDSWFLRYVQVIPCYRQAGLGAWGDFYHGESSYVYFNADGSIDKIVAPYVKGSLSADMERPVIVLHEAANGNPTESDYSYFEFNNSREDYFFEMKGRWYTTNDFDIYRDKLVWKYKYSTLLKNDLSTWVTVADGKNSVGKFQFDILGKSSWENLITSYPVDDRNYIGGSYALVNKITGYSDAVDTLKMLLKQPYSLYNGYEVYVRYYRYDENGSIEYSKWTHFYNNLANSEGSSGSRLDDLDNMYSENQSDKGLTDDELSDLENTGNSRNDLDAVPKNNYDYSSLETATMNFFDLLTNYGSMLGQFPSMVTAVFGFLPGWLIGLIALAIGAVIVCRFIGR